MMYVNFIAFWNRTRQRVLPFLDVTSEQRYLSIMVRYANAITIAFSSAQNRIIIYQLDF